MFFGFTVYGLGLGPTLCVTTFSPRWPAHAHQPAQGALAVAAGLTAAVPAHLRVADCSCGSRCAAELVLTASG